VTVRRWVARPGDGNTLGEVLARAGADEQALRQGRVFIGRKRAKADNEPVAVGEVVEIAAPAAESEFEPSLAVLARQGDLVAVAKPAGMPTIADHRGAAHALVPRAAAQLGLDVSRVHPTSRLDRDVSGVVILALSPAAAARLVDARAQGHYERRYVAIASHAPVPRQGAWDAAIGRASNPRLRRVRGHDSTDALTCYAVSGTAPRGEALLAVAPITGRTHQIRVHAAHAGAPLLGDRDYGGAVRMTLPDGRVLEPRRIALHAARVVIRVARGEPFMAQAPVPKDLLDLWAALGGEPSAWDVCLSCDLK
jgi:23S rRNA pseudouridine1911/1915/1917 synthase